MPHFYFNTSEGSRYFFDADGQDCNSRTSAELEAACAAGELARDCLRKGESQEVSVEVRNEQGERVVTVTVTMEVDRVEPASEH
jgi:hypothetical protein